jgi:hypothetical protein
MNIFKMIVAFTVSAIACTLAVCQSDVAGNSSQTGSSGVAVASVNGVISGMTTPDAVVSVYVKDYVAKSNRFFYSDTVLADKTGRFSFEQVDNNYYNLLVVDSIGEMGFIRNIPAFKDTVFDTSLVKLEKAGSVTGVTHSKDGPILGNALVRVKGSPFFTIADERGTFRLESIPSGRQEIQIINDQVVSITEVIVDTLDITIVPDSVIVWEKIK